ncbi:MAG: anthranilate synthase component I family protein [Spirochaetota bacterium]
MNLRIRHVSLKTQEYRTPEKVFQPLANQPYAVLLTGEGACGVAESSLIATQPQFVLFYEEGFQTYPEQKLSRGFWQVQQQVLAATNFHNYAFPINRCGIIGYLTYNSKKFTEDLPKLVRSDYQIPLMQMVLYRHYMYFDHAQHSLYEIYLDYETEPAKAFVPNTFVRTGDFYLGSLQSDIGQKEYLEKIKSIQAAIRRGEVYEVNLSRRIQAEFRGNPYSFFQALYHKNPAPFSVFWNMPEFQILSTSPELFLRAEQRQVQTRPIKGTAPRGLTKEEDRQNRNKLYANEKEQAELYMIVDLLRNDLGKVSEFASVVVDAKKKLETYRQVHHLVSIIRSRLIQGITYIDLLKACFPGGSITGCPKIRCMQILEELEVYERNLYTGTIYVMNQDYCNSNIAIRSGIIKDGWCYFHTGGAITIDSDPQKEYQETEHKIRHFLELAASYTVPEKKHIL